jgi:hypothetical protein
VIRRTPRTLRAPRGAATPHATHAMTHRLLAAAAPFVLVPLAARAQAPLALDVAARAMKAASWTYASTLTSNGQSQGFGVRTVAVSASKYRGADAWLLLDTQQNPMGTAADSLFLGRADLASLRRVTHIAAPMGEMVLTMDFTADSVTGLLTAGGQSQPVAMANTRGSVVGDAVVLAVLSALPLGDGWKGVLPVLNPQARAAVPLTLAVTGSEKVTVPAGTFDAWVLKAESGPTTATYYVAKGGPVLKVVAQLPQLGGAQIETVLERTGPAR